MSSASVPPAVSVPAVPAIAGYRPVALLGAGGMASVWMAARADGGWCALKAIHPHVVDVDSVQGRFDREAQVVALLRHRNIAGVNRAGTHGRQPYLDMELVEGVSLGALVDRLREHGQPVPPGLIWRVNDGVLRALEYAHDREGPDGPLGIVHRDLSPSNVLIGFDGVARIIDFGMVRACLGAFQTMLGQIGGTPQYMSPEQARARQVDRRSDLYAWAVVLVEVLTGHVLVKKGNLPMTLKSILDDPAPALTDLGPDLPPALNPLFASMLAKAPDQRPASAEAVRSAFDEIVGRATWPETDVGDLVRRVFSDRFEVFRRLKTIERDRSAPVDALLASPALAPTVERTGAITEPAAPAPSARATKPQPR